MNRVAGLRAVRHVQQVCGRVAHRVGGSCEEYSEAAAEFFGSTVVVMCRLL